MTHLTAPNPSLEQAREGLAMDATQSEQWRPVVGYEGLYEVSDQGQVRSVDRIIVLRNGRRRHFKGHVLRPAKNKHHQHVALPRPDGKQYTIRIHVLVLEAFVGPRPPGLVACHNNGDGYDNRLSNLRWDTYSSNNQDLVKHGTHWQTAKTHCPQGHPYDYMDGPRHRRCRRCQRAAGRRAYLKRKAKHGDLQAE